jgi:CRP/FNR family transcriptional regulator, cyclic AMP receptor protein
MQWALFGDLPPEELRRVLSIARRRVFDRGEVVFHEGDPADTLHLIAKGRFAVRIRTAVGDRVTVAIRGPGEAFGELALAGPEPAPRSATVAALEAGETHSVHRSDFDRLRRQHPGVNAILVELLAEEVRRVGSLAIEAFFVDAEKRVLRRLLDLAGIYGKDGGEPAAIPLTQEELAELAGTSRATVNRVLRREAGRGSLLLRRGVTTVVDAGELQRRSR